MPFSLMENRSDIELRIRRARQSSESAAIDFVLTELTVGITRCQIARGRRQLGLDASMAIQQAQAALHSASSSMQRFRPLYPEFDQMTALAERLRMELDALTNPGNQALDLDLTDGTQQTTRKPGQTRSAP